MHTDLIGPFVGDGQNPIGIAGADAIDIAAMVPALGTSRDLLRRSGEQQAEIVSGEKAAVINPSPCEQVARLNAKGQHVGPGARKAWKPVAFGWNWCKQNLRVCFLVVSWWHVT